MMPSEWHHRFMLSLEEQLSGDEPLMMDAHLAILRGIAPERFAAELAVRLSDALKLRPLNFQAERPDLNHDGDCSYRLGGECDCNKDARCPFCGTELADGPKHCPRCKEPM